MKTIFSFHNKPTCNFLGSDGSSYAITLFDTGIVRCEYYPKLYRNTPSEVREFGPFPEAAKKVKEIIDLYSAETEHYPDFINNDTDDGNWQHFQLGEKKIVIDNMNHYTENDIRRICFFHEAHKEYEELEKRLILIRQNNTMYEILCKVSTAIMKNCNFSEEFAFPPKNTL